MNPFMTTPDSSLSTGARVFNLALDQAIPFIGNLAHHCVSELHLWIGVEHGVLVCLDDDEHRFFEDLVKGMSPALVLNQICHKGMDSTMICHQWTRIIELVTKLAEADFITVINGYHEVRPLQPERFARLHLTRRCQLRCIHCYAESGPEADGSREMPTHRWKQLIDSIAENGGESVLFTGGEPLIREDCTDLMRHACQKNLEVTLFTNGLEVDKRLIELVDYVNLVQVSLNGPDEVSNDSIRGKGTFRKVMRAVNLLLKANVSVRVGMTVMERNWQAIKTGFLPFAERFTGTSLRFHLGYGVCNYGRATSLGDCLDLEEVRPILDEFLERVNPYEGRRITRRTTSCGYCEQLVVSPEGFVYPCHLLDGPLGHIDERPIPDWHTFLKKTAIKHQVTEIEGCRECDLRNLCGGTCRVLNEKSTGSKFITSCAQEDREARYRNLARLYYHPTKPQVE